MLLKEELKKNELWTFYMECDLDIRFRPWGVRRFKDTRGKGKMVWASTLGPCMFFGPKMVRPRFING